MDGEKQKPSTSSRRKRAENEPNVSNRRKKRAVTESNVPVEPQVAPASDFEHSSSDGDDDEGWEAGSEEGEEEGEKGGDEEAAEQDILPSPPLLNGFQAHVAKYIYQGTDRGVLRCHSHVSKLLSWRLNDQGDNSRWRTLFEKSKLLKVRFGSYKHPNKNLITAFVERWHPETNSFHFPFGEMTITLDDVYCLTGLPVDGIPVQPMHEVQRKGRDYVMELLGRTEEEAIEAVGGERGSSVKLLWLRDTFAKLMNSANEDDVLYSARAYVLYTFGTTLFPDKTGSRVNCSWLQYTEDMTKFSDYAWGAATLAYLYRQLGLASKFKVRQIGGYLTLLEAWIYEHFPTLILPPQNPDFKHPEPLSGKYAPEAHTSPNPNRVRSFRERLDILQGSEVKWNPYAVLRDDYEFKEVSYFHGCIVCGDVVEPYMPDRVLRQFGYVQTVPEKPLGTRVARGGSKKIKLVWGTLAAYFSVWDAHVLTVDRLGSEANHPWECSSDYIDWFLNNSHPYVSNPRTMKLTPREPRLSLEPWDRNEAAKHDLKLLEQKWRNGDRLTVDEVMQVVVQTITTLEGPEKAGPSSRASSGRGNTTTRPRSRGRARRTESSSLSVPATEIVLRSPAGGGDCSPLSLLRLMPFLAGELQN